MNEQIYDHLRTGLDIIRKRADAIMDCNNFGFVYANTHAIIGEAKVLQDLIDRTMTAIRDVLRSPSEYDDDR